VKLRTLGIIIIAATLTAHAQQTQPDSPQEQQGTATDQQAQTHATADQQGGVQQQNADPGQQQAAPVDPRMNPPVNFSHHHQVYPNTIQQADPGDPTIEQRNCGAALRPRSVDSVTRAINPDDINYGGIFSQWHRELVSDTLLNVVYWVMMCALVAVIVLLLYIYWLLRQRDQRMRVTVDMVLQLINSRNYARYHNLRIIKIHNDLVDRINDQYERELRENGDGPRATDSSAIPGLASILSGGSSEDSQLDLSPDATSNQFDETSITQTVAAASNRSEQISNIPSVAAATEFGIDRSPRFMQGGFQKKNQGVDANTAGTVQSDVDIALARANAAAAGEQIPVAAGAKEEEDQQVVIRRLTAQVKALEQHKVSLRNQVNQLRQASAAGELDDSGEQQ
jgi:hypothetical protein